MKTISLKKVSAVAVASLGFGLMSVVPANAVGEELLGAVNATAITASKVTVTPTVGSAVSVKFGATLAALVATVGSTSDKVTFKAALTSVPAGGSVGVTSVLAAAASPAGTATAVAVTAGTVPTLTASATLPKFEIVLAADDLTTWSAQTLTYLGAFNFTPTKAGVHSMTVWNDADRDDTVDATETYQTAAITVVAPSGYSNSLSTGFITYGDGTTTPSSTTTALQNTVSSTASTSNRATISAVINDTAGAAYPVGALLSAEISGPGYLKWANQAITATQCDVSPTYGANVGRSLAARAVDAQSVVYVCADGTTGVSTVTIKITDAAEVVTTLATRTVTFAGAVSKIVATGVLTIAKSGGAALGASDANRTTTANTPSFIVNATDSAGNGVSGLSFTALSSATAIMVSSLTCTEDVKTTANIFSSGGIGFYNCLATSSSGAVSGNTATLTVRVVDPAGDGTTFLTSDVKYTIGGTATTGTETLSFDKLSYAPGEAMIVTRTAKDSSGNPVHDFLASPAVAFNKAPGGTVPGIGAYVGGKSASSTTAATATVFAPVTPGSFIATATAANGATITATATVTDANAGLLTQIDALNAKIVALNALIAKIMKKLGVK